MKRYVIIVLALALSMWIGATLPAGAQTGNISPIAEPDPSYLVAQVIDDDPEPEDFPGVVSADKPDTREAHEVPVDAGPRMVYAGGPLGWVPVYDYDERNEQ